jgi:hypothetical protein
MAANHCYIKIYLIITVYGKNNHPHLQDHGGIHNFAANIPVYRMEARPEDQSSQNDFDSWG